MKVAAFMYGGIFENAAPLMGLESFSYALPHKSDYKNLGPEKYVEWAKRLLKDRYLNEEFEEYQEKLTKAREIEKDVNLVNSALRTLAAGNTRDFMRAEKAVTGAIKRLAKVFHINEWAVLNLFSDMKQYLT